MLFQTPSEKVLKTAQTNVKTKVFELFSEQNRQANDPIPETSAQSNDLSFELSFRACSLVASIESRRILYSLSAAAGKEPGAQTLRPHLWLLRPFSLQGIDRSES